MNNLDLIKFIEKIYIQNNKNDNNFYDLSDLTIIIPTYNRPKVFNSPDSLFIKLHIKLNNNGW